MPCPCGAAGLMEATREPRRLGKSESVSAGPRFASALLAAVCLGPLVVAAFLTPSAAGHGTHTQLGMPQCGWAQYFGKPCMTCGMTTAFAHAVRLDFLTAARDQPMGLVLAIGCGIGFWVMLYSAITGSDLAGLAGRRLSRPGFLWTLAGMAALAWAYKWLTWSSG